MDLDEPIKDKNKCNSNYFVVVNSEEKTFLVFVLCEVYKNIGKYILDLILGK